jgi:hypothetical protein
MEIVFRVPAAAGGMDLGPGEVGVTAPADAGPSPLALAELVLERGVAALPRGEGPARCVVVPSDPALDDMLAAEIAARLMEEGEVPRAGLAALARYAALVREGLRPGTVPPEVSLEGVYLAVRTAASADLTDPETARRFRADWSRLADCLMRAAAEGGDPFSVSPCASGPEFARERAFLARDHEVYRSDVARGQRWDVRLSGGPPAAAGLLLRQPRSLLFRYWARGDAEAPGGRGYLFLAVDWGRGEWVFSTDPVHRVPIAPLAARLQAAEWAADPARAEADPWYDGRRHAGTLVAAPRRGTALSEAQVIRAVKQWAGAREVRPGRVMPPMALRALAAAGLVVGLIVYLAAAWPRDRGSGPGPSPKLLCLPPSLGGASRLFVLTVGVSKYRDAALGLDCHEKDAADLAAFFEGQRGRAGFKSVEVVCLKNERATKRGLLEALVGLRPVLGDLVVIALAGHGRMSETRRFFFLPHDFEGGGPVQAGGVAWEDFKEQVDRMPCTVVLAMDTCDSGAITGQLERSRGLSPLADRKREIEEALRDYQNSPSGVFVIAASMAGQPARENRAKWGGHGALTLALLEGLTGARIASFGDDVALPHESAPGETVLTLEKLTRYVTDRVAQVTEGRQSVIHNHSGNMDPGRVPIAVIRGPEREPTTQ